MSNSLPHRPIVFIDRNSGGRTFRELILAGGINVRLHDEEFTDKKTADEVWLAEIAKRGWIIVTGDDMSRNYLFLERLKRSNARVFHLPGLNSATREGRAQCVISAYEKMITVCQKFNPPFLWRINSEGAAVVVDFRQILGLARRAAKTDLNHPLSSHR